MRLFNTVQLDSEPPMVYSQMPKTSTRKIEWDKIAETMAYKLGSNIWSEYYITGR